MHKKTPESKTPPKKTKPLPESIRENINNSGHAFEIAIVRNPEGADKFSVQLRIDKVMGEMAGKSTLLGSVIKGIVPSRKTPLVGKTAHPCIFSKTQMNQVCDVLDHVTYPKGAKLGQNWKFSEAVNKHDHRYIRTYVDSEEAGREILNLLKEKGFNADLDSDVKEVKRRSGRRKPPPGKGENQR